MGKRDHDAILWYVSDLAQCFYQVVVLALHQSAQVELDTDQGNGSAGYRPEGHDITDEWTMHAGCLIVPGCPP
jgi:hypothetical protein